MMKRTLVVVVLALSVVIAGCGGPGDAPEEENESPGEEPGEEPVEAENETDEEPAEAENETGDEDALLTGPASTGLAIGTG